MAFLCEVCGRTFALEQQLKMHSTIHLGTNRQPKERTPPLETPQREITFKKPEYQQELDRKRLELESLRIDNEIKRLSAPDVPETQYFKEMLAQQQQHFNQLLLMSQQQNELKLEIEKLKLGSESEDFTQPILLELVKNLPVIMEAKKKEVERAKEPQKEVKPMKVTKKELEIYQERIRNGEISEEQAYKDFIEQEPKLAKLITREQFNKGFAEIKAGKKINIPPAP